MSLTCLEWQHVPSRENGISNAEANRFLALAEQSARRLKLPETGVLVRTSTGLQARQVVGVLVLPGRTLEILPKIDGSLQEVRTALIRMLAVAHDLRVADGELTGLTTQPHDLLELLIRLFAERLRAVVRRGLPRRYVTREDDLQLLRGSLDIVRHFTQFATRPGLLACRFDDLSENTPLNRVLKAAVLRLSRLTSSSASFRMLAELSARFELAGDSPRPLAETVHLDRTNSAFHDLYRLARVILTDDWQTTTSGRTLGFSLLFPMNDLFEKFIGRSLQRALAPKPVELQRGDLYALEDDRGRRLFKLVPDMVIEPTGKRIVLDTKWKWLDTSQRNLGIEHADVYQMLAYGRAWRAARVILLYPWHQGINEPAGLLRAWHAAGTGGLPVDVATVDVRRPEQVEDCLREILSPSEISAYFQTPV